MQYSPRPQGDGDGKAYDVGRQRQRQHSCYPPEGAAWEVRAHRKPGDGGGHQDAANHHRGHQRQRPQHDPQGSGAENQFGGVRAGAHRPQQQVCRREQQQRSDNYRRQPDGRGWTGYVVVERPHQGAARLISPLGNCHQCCSTMGAMPGGCRESVCWGSPTAGGGGAARRSAGRGFFGVV